MPDETIDHKRPAHAESDLHKMQQRLVDETVDESFPASDPPAWTTTGAKSVAAKLESEDTAKGHDEQGRGETAGTVQRVMDQASNVAQEAYQRGGEYVRQGRNRIPDVQRYAQQGTRMMARPVEQHPLAALLVAGAVGYGLAWLIHNRAAGTGKARTSRDGDRLPRGPAVADASRSDRPLPSGDSPKPHGDELLNTIRSAPDERDRS